MSDMKEDILKFLLKYKNQARINGEHFKIQAYDKVIKNIERKKESISCLSDLDDISGIGKSIKEKLNQFFDLKSKEMTSDNELFSDLIKIYGVGSKKVTELINKYNVISILDLKNKVKENPSILTNAQKIGLYCYNDLLESIPRAEMLEHEIILNLKEFSGEIVGSFRRKEAISGDIDVMLNMSVDEFDEFIGHLIDIKYLKFVLSKGDKKLLGICSLNNGKYRRIDLIRNSKEEYPFMKLYFTGSKDFNIAFRKHCLSLGLSLNERGFTPVVNGLYSEKDIFDYFKMNQYYDNN